MAKGHLIDSNAIIGYLDNKIPAKGMAFMNGVVNSIPNISVMSKIEVLSFNAPKEAYDILLDFIGISAVIDLTEDVVQTTIQLRKAHKIKTPDAIIAATALVHGLVLITRNTSDFKNIPGLDLLNPWDI